jgi:hypothetical protein
VASELHLFPNGKDERSGLWTRMATESVSLREDEKLTAFVELEWAMGR